MCTVSFLPKGGNDFILTSNRDENILREVAKDPSIFHRNHLKVLYPEDTNSKGTWISAAENGICLCLLNGGFVSHKRKPPYRKSRGLVHLDFYEYNNVNQFMVNYDLKGIEPFTLIIIESKNKLKVNELRWDGKRIHRTIIDETRPKIWSSVTLYSKEIIAEREKWFAEWLFANPDLESDSIKRFHHTGGSGDLKNDLRMKREQVFTVSITCVVKEDKNFQMMYSDLIKGKESLSVLEIS
ncbi:MAG: NRDE family protein [Flavobacteriales bacterium]|nr:NRDE family protein [Flavobacteriales bacterium]